MKPKALFKHDCDKCQYLGNLFVPTQNTMADVYLSCEFKDIPDLRSVILRYSDDEPDYASVNLSSLGSYFKQL